MLTLLLAGVLLDAGLAFGVQINFWSLLVAMSISAAYSLFRCARHGARHSSKFGTACPSRTARNVFVVILLPAILTGALVWITPSGVITALSSGTDNAAWLFVASQFGSQQEIWPGHGGPMTVLIALSTGVGRLVAVPLSANMTSAAVAVSAVTFLTLSSIVGSVVLTRAIGGNRRTTTAFGGVLAVGLLLLSDFGHLSAWLVIVAVTTSLALHDRADDREKLTLLWIAALSLTLWFPVEPLALACSLGTLIWGLKIGRQERAFRRVVLLDAVVMVVPLAVSLRSFALHISSVGAFASGFSALSLPDLVVGAAEYLARPGGTHSLGWILPLGVAVLGGVTLWKSPRARTAPSGVVLVLCLWAVGMWCIDMYVNAQSGYGSQKLILVATIVCSAWITTSARESRLMVTLAVTLPLVAALLSMARTHMPDGEEVVPRGDTSWVQLAASHLRADTSTLPRACLTDPSWQMFDDPVADDRDQWSAFTCTRFLGSLAAMDDLPNDILRFNAGLETWRWVATRANSNPFLQSDVAILGDDGVPYRTPRLIDYIAETSSLRKLSVETRSEVSEVVLDDELPHSIDVVDSRTGIIEGWAGSRVASVVIVSDGLPTAVPDVAPRFPRSDVELVVGVRELASGFSTQVSLAESAPVCILLRGIDGALYLSQLDEVCLARDDISEHLRR